MDGLEVSTLLELLDDCCGITKKNVGKIDLKGAYSFFEVDKEKSQDVIKGFQGIEFANRAVRVELTEQQGGGGRSRERSEGGPRERRSEGGNRSEGGSRERSTSGQRSGGYGNREGSGSRDRNRGAGSSGSSNRPGNFERRGSSDRKKRY
jgi:ATP-dependent RNA helicase DeaD